MKLNRRWYRALPVVAAMLIGACSTDSALAPADLNLKKDPPPPNVNGPVWILGDIALTVTIGEGGVGENKHPQGKGRCGDPNEGEDPAVWYAPGNDEANTGAKFCEASEGEDLVLECSIDENGLPATYAFGTGGLGAPTNLQTTNQENINFHSDLIPIADDQFVHYYPAENKNKVANTVGKDWTAFTMTCTGGEVFDGYLDLSAFTGAGNKFFGGGSCEGNRCLNTGSGIPVDLYAEGEGPYDDDPPSDTVGEGTLTSLYWIFRSRIPN